MLRSPSYPAPRFGINPQAYALKQAFAKREEGIAYKQAYKAATEKYSQVATPIELADMVLQCTTPDSAEGNALYDLMKAKLYYSAPNAKATFFHIRKQVASQSAPPQPNTGASKIIQHLLNECLKRNQINAGDLDHYHPVFHEKDEALFLKTLKDMIEADHKQQYRSYHGNLPYSPVHSIPLLVDIIDYAQSNPPRNEILGNADCIAVFAAPLIEMLDKGAPPLSISVQQTQVLKRREVAQAMVEQFQKKGYFSEDGVKLLPEPLAKKIFEVIAIPDDV